MTARPADRTRRSPLYRTQIRAGASFEIVGDAMITAAFSDPAEEAEMAKRLAVADLFTLFRIGFKGPQAASWLQSNGIPLPGRTNLSVRAAENTLVARLGASDFLICDHVANSGRLIPDLDERWSSDAPRECYRVAFAESSFCIAICGQAAPELMSRICAVDLRPAAFHADMVAQTMVAGISTTMIRADRGPNLGFLFLGDAAATEYVWTVLEDAMAEFGGRQIGLKALSMLAG